MKYKIYNNIVLYNNLENYLENNFNYFHLFSSLNINNIKYFNENYIIEHKSILIDKLESSTIIGNKNHKLLISIDIDKLYKLIESNKFNCIKFNNIDDIIKNNLILSFKIYFNDNLICNYDKKTPKNTIRPKIAVTIGKFKINNIYPNDICNIIMKLNELNQFDELNNIKKDINYLIIILSLFINGYECNIKSNDVLCFNQFIQSPTYDMIKPAIKYETEPQREESNLEESNTTTTTTTTAKNQDYNFSLGELEFDLPSDDE